MGRMRRGIVATGLGVGAFLAMHEGMHYGNAETDDVQGCARALGNISLSSEAVLAACGSHLDEFKKIPVTLNDHTKGVAYDLPNSTTFLQRHLESAKISDRHWQYAENGLDILLGGIVGIAAYSIAEVTSEASRRQAGQLPA